MILKHRQKIVAKYAAGKLSAKRMAREVARLNEQYALKQEDD